MYAKTPAARFATRAVHAYRQAVLLYPNSNILHAQLAWALRLAGEQPAARREAAEALRLDRLVPHPELKLEAQKLVGVVPRPGLPQDAQAEQIVHFLRTAP
jgi:hypothetical protein